MRLEENIDKSLLGVTYLGVEDRVSIRGVDVQRPVQDIHLGDRACLQTHAIVTLSHIASQLTDVSIRLLRREALSVLAEHALLHVRVVGIRGGERKKGVFESNCPITFQSILVRL